MRNEYPRGGLWHLYLDDFASSVQRTVLAIAALPAGSMPPHLTSARTTLVSPDRQVQGVYQYLFDAIDFVAFSFLLLARTIVCPYGKNVVHISMNESTLADELLPHLADRQFDESNTRVKDVALECVFRSVPDFWRRIAVEFVGEVFTWHLSTIDVIRTTSSYRLEQLANGLRYVFKANAERLMSLPSHQLTTDAEAASEWIRNELARQSLQNDASTRDMMEMNVAKAR
ncbi:hypothetical protein [Paraburkholderia caribensis]|uniref:hypothetical protein n=1 Tax=Paraburkholderia caribensis TaxID=75105 RepID=UPI0034D32914